MTLETKPLAPDSGSFESPGISRISAMASGIDNFEYIVGIVRLINVVGMLLLALIGH